MWKASISSSCLLMGGWDKCFERESILIRKEKKFRCWSSKMCWASCFKKRRATLHSWFASRGNVAKKSIIVSFVKFVNFVQLFGHFIIALIILSLQTCGVTHISKYGISRDQWGHSQWGWLDEFQTSRHRDGFLRPSNKSAAQCARACAPHANWTFQARWQHSADSERKSEREEMWGGRVTPDNNQVGAPGQPQN